VNGPTDKEAPMTLHPQARAALDRMVEGNPPPIHTLSVEEARAAHMATMWMSAPGEPVANVEDLVAPGSGGDLRVRVYTPAGRGPWPILVYFHGGGWVVGNLQTVDALCRTLASRTPCVVVSVDYPLAPEHPFPAALDACYAAAAWAEAGAQELGGAEAGGGRPRVAVGGDSAGGNLAAAVALMARARGGPTISHQLLIYPVIANDFDTPSYKDNAEGFGLTRDGMKWYWDLYTSGAHEALDPRASVLREPDLSDLPPALVITAEHDVLRDEGRAYAQALSEAGVEVRALDYDGMIHGFFRMTAVLDSASQAIDEAASELRSATS